MTKRLFTEKCDIHTYGHGHGAIKVLYFHWLAAYSKESGSFAGFKYAIAAQSITKRKLIDLAYKRIILNETITHNAWLGVKLAKTDAERFKVPLGFYVDQYKHQSIFDV